MRDRRRRRQASVDKNLRQFCYDLIELVPARVMERKYFTFYRDLNRAAVRVKKRSQRRSKLKVGSMQPARRPGGADCISHKVAGVFGAIRDFQLATQFIYKKSILGLSARF